MRFARFVLAAQALVMVGFSLAYWLRPYEMANLNGVLLMESASISHMRVYYGGMQLGLALFLLWATRAPDRARAALVMLVMLLFSMLALAIGRLLSLGIDGGPLLGFDLASLVYQLLAALLAGIAWWTLRDNDVGTAEPDLEPPAVRQIDLDCTPPQPFRVGEGSIPSTSEIDGAGEVTAPASRHDSPLR
jgi:hypothetical protein